VESSFDTQDIQPAPYSVQTLRKIMETRKSAFKPDVLTDDVIPKAAAIAGAEHGDARRAIRILRHAGEAAAKEDAELVTRDHIDIARREAEKNRFGETIQNATTHETLVLLAIANLTLAHDDRKEFKQSEVYDRYTEEAELVDTEPLSQRRVRDLVNDYALLDVLETEKRNYGKQSGIHRVIQILLDPEIVRDVIEATRV
jgi:cell division control protein 6